MGLKQLPLVLIWINQQQETDEYVDTFKDLQCGLKHYVPPRYCRLLISLGDSEIGSEETSKMNGSQ